ncbi:Endonuclease/Exonuclease/phosphatase family protein [Nonlabens dokdonensis]|uniref:Endonuclease/exonuclease/phosphatase family protein n=3 Tax=Nonlabens dokdonensis TaxID=328515 RepID=L7W8T2_NONDD|nr:endonuclease/exonuclease/phosphatase family protein [Nonlabens dokdonensis DSW-6]PZX43887.1 Endonuclease/Exonuclease/phosphatase family protein [Nonlabens dokdonensis]
MSALCVFAFAKASQAQTAKKSKQYKVKTVAFYNLENLFDIEDDTSIYDERSPIMEMAEGVRADVYQKKLTSMARVIRKIGAETSQTAPSIIGVCEVENRKVLEDLVNHPLLIEYDYGIEHYDSPDERGIDTGLLYKKSDFKVLNSDSKELIIYNQSTGKRNYTRDQLVVTGELDGDKMSFIVNHWPSRGGGELKSRPGRIAAAKLNQKVIDSLHSIDAMSKVFVMGDLNDYPSDESVKVALNAQEDRSKVRPQMIYNPYMQMGKDGFGTTAYRDAVGIFDQIMFTYPLLNEAKRDGYRYYNAHIFNPSFMTNKAGRYKGYPLRSFADGTFTGGFSDHFPVYVYLVKEIKNNGDK